MQKKPRHKVTFSLDPQAVSFISFLRATLEHDLGFPVSFDDTLNYVICNYELCLSNGVMSDDVV